MKLGEVSYYIVYKVTIEPPPYNSSLYLWMSLLSLCLDEMFKNLEYYSSW